VLGPESSSRVISKKKPFSRGTISIPVNASVMSTGTLAIKLTGGSLGGAFGSKAEGYSITSITFTVQYKTSSSRWIQEYSEAESGYAPKTVTAPVTIKYKISRRC